MGPSGDPGERLRAIRERVAALRAYMGPRSHGEWPDVDVVKRALDVSRGATANYLPDCEALLDRIAELERERDAAKAEAAQWQEAVALYARLAALRAGG